MPNNVVSDQTAVTISGVTRRGECNHCGWCCQFLGVYRTTVDDESAEAERFYSLRHGVKCADGKLRLLTHQFAPCTAHDTVQTRCTIYDDRPETCRVFPSTPEQIEGTPCSHWFEGEDGTKRGGLGSPYPTPPRFTA
jgi:Fe-S-cluster containining protein